MKNGGFTLIELAIVLVVIGLLLGIGAGMIGPLIKRTKYQETRERLKANVESLIGYALTHGGKLPARCTNNIRYLKDAWGKDIQCIIERKLTLQSICKINHTTLKVKDENEANTNQEIAFILLSSGPNYNLQTNIKRRIIYIHKSGKKIDDYCSSSKDPCRPEAYDDIPEYILLNQIKTILFKAGICK